MNHPSTSKLNRPGVNTKQHGWQRRTKLVTIWFSVNIDRQSSNTLYVITSRQSTNGIVCDVLWWILCRWWCVERWLRSCVVIECVYTFYLPNPDLYSSKTNKTTSQLRKSLVFTDFWPGGSFMGVVHWWSGTSYLNITEFFKPLNIQMRGLLNIQ